MIQIDVFQDLVCPWCRIGKKNLGDAIAEWEQAGGEPVEVTYRAFQLAPELPPEGKPFLEEMSRKAGTADGVRRMTGQVTEAGAAVGLTFRFDRVTRMPNTRLAHRLAAVAPASERGKLVDALYRAYFEEGRDLASRDVLLEIAAETGLDAAALGARLDAGEGEAAVDADLAQSRAIGVSGVPFFVLGRRYAMSGAYPPAQLLKALERIAREKNAAAE